MIKRAEYDAQHGTVETPQDGMVMQLATALGYKLERGTFVRTKRQYNKTKVSRNFTPRGTYQQAPTYRTASKKRSAQFPKTLLADMRALGVGEELDITDTLRALGISSKSAIHRIYTFSWLERNRHGDDRKIVAHKVGHRVIVRRSA